VPCISKKGDMLKILGRSTLPFALGIMWVTPPSLSAEFGDVEKGRILYQQCSECHAIGNGAENIDGVGPHLNALFGRRVASVKNYSYTESLTHLGAAGVEWHADTLSTFLKNPQSIAAGTRMTYMIEDPKQRSDLIAYLRIFSDHPSDIPEADPTARPSDHALDPEILALSGDAEYGAYHSSECVACHQPDHQGTGIPSIVHWPERQFVRAMHLYKKKVRPNPVMQMIAGRLSNEEIAALAAYFNNFND